jgi:sulfate transport system ATP-binding protein
MSIRMTEISKRFGDHLVVNRINLEVKSGELFVLLGGSGSGKSTILRMIAGLSPPDNGTIELNGLEVTNLSPQKRNTGFVFQNYSIFRHMTVAENIEFGLRIRRISAGERTQRSEELLDMVGLTGLGSRYSEQISGGQRQRVALARALAYNPAVLLLDEPFGALDVKIRAQLRESLKEIQKRLNVTTILVTHDQEEAFELGNRIGIIDKGNLIEVGDPEELYQRPKTEFVATFIGGGNVLVGRVKDKQIQLGPVSLRFPNDAPVHEEGSPVRILIRPESILLQKNKFRLIKDMKLSVPGKVTERIFTGSQQRIRMEVESLQGFWPVGSRFGNQITRFDVIQPNREPNRQFLPGESVWIGVKQFHVLEPTGLKVLICFDPQSTDNGPLEFGCKLAELTHGPTNALTIVGPEAPLDEVRDRLALLKSERFSHLPNLETKARQGNAATEIILETQEGRYEVIILGRQKRSIGFIAHQILTQAKVPVLLIESVRPKIERILICTAAGEPGKMDVLFGGRVARQVGAQVVVLHVPHPNSSRLSLNRIERHLNQTQKTLEALGVQTEYRIKEYAPLVLGITQEIEDGDYDLVVIGAPLQPHLHQISWMDIASQIIQGTSRPVLVVPAIF